MRSCLRKCGASAHHGAGGAKTAARAERNRGEGVLRRALT